MGSKSQLAFIYVYIYNMSVTFWAEVGPPGFKMAALQLRAEVAAHELSEVWTSLLQSFIKEGLLQLPG